MCYMERDAAGDYIFTCAPEDQAPAKTMEETTALPPPPPFVPEPYVHLSDEALAKRILLVEDNTVNQRLILNILRAHGHTTVDVAANGKEGVDMVTADPSAYSLILMDVSMPVMSGFEATSLIRDMGLDVPIIALAAHAMKADQESFLQRGFDGYLSKPVRKMVVHKLLLEWLENEAPMESESQPNFSHEEGLPRHNKL
ncbi:hypothetical protein V494_05365 [Pseudogymnoascus sp. VKM F-4513 (FW-928)]|nr:hypothetical protein V494_05365 [Pseudogymnoascus sp. VKM F-4513 (FW-928)]